MDRATCSAVRTRPLRAGTEPFDAASLFRRLTPLEGEVDDEPTGVPRPRRTRPLVAAAPGIDRAPVEVDPGMDGGLPSAIPRRASVDRWDDLPPWVDDVPWDDGSGEDPASGDRSWAVPPASAIEAVFRTSARDSVLFGPPS